MTTKILDYSAMTLDVGYSYIYTILDSVTKKWYFV
jgi:hypothetical protein